MSLPQGQYKLNSYTKMTMEQPFTSKLLDLDRAWRQHMDVIGRHVMRKLVQIEADGRRKLWKRFGLR